MPYAPKPGALTAISPSGLAWLLGDLGWRLHPLLPLQLFPPTHRALTSSQALPRSAFLSLRGAPWPASSGPPISCAAAAPTPPPLDSGWKISLLKMGGSFSSPPGRPGRPKVSGEGGWAPRPPARGEVTRPQTHNRGTRLGQLGKLHIPSGEGLAPRRRQTFLTQAPGATCRRSTGPHLPETPLSSRPRTKQSEHWNAESIYLSMRPGGWPLNLNILHRVLALQAVGGCKIGSWSPCRGQWNQGPEVACP